MAYEVNLKAWDKADRAACQIIVKALEAKVMALLVACDNAREMWDKLHGIFEQQTKQASHVVQSEYFGFSMDPSDDMVTHIAKFEGLILRMQHLNVKPDKSSVIVKLIDTLPEEYESLRQAWWARPDDQQTVENLVALLTSDEKRRMHQNRMR
ncbi:copia protein [Lasius niger]|uniref:Copia protein n=1 Tax=Lasius niger TaxID=67767 RepID=A0A0J7K7U3_LASNI|nr:copia protein [Lasius niger]KMQ86266.1 copia protein [Lasius niger]